MSKNGWIQEAINDAGFNQDAVRLAYIQAHLLLGIVESLDALTAALNNPKGNGKDNGADGGEAK